MNTNSSRTGLPLLEQSRQLLTIARLERRLTLRQLSDATGITPSQLSRYETGKCNPTHAALKRLTSFLGLRFVGSHCYIWREHKDRQVSHVGETAITVVDDE